MFACKLDMAVLFISILRFMRYCILPNEVKALNVPKQLTLGITRLSARNK